MLRIWTVHATSRKTGHRSQWGPFEGAVSAAAWCEVNRRPDDWRRVLITSCSQIKEPTNESRQEPNGT